jgi:hypothetical protein
VKDGVRAALQDLRDLARGIYPPLLADQGLAAAVGAQASKAEGPVEVSTDGVGRYPVELETAVYFCCVEALQNAARHAPGSAVRVSLAEDRGQVVFTVTDIAERLVLSRKTVDLSFGPVGGTRFMDSTKQAQGEIRMAPGPVQDPSGNLCNLLGGSGETRHERQDFLEREICQIDTLTDVERCPLGIFDEICRGGYPD